MDAVTVTRIGTQVVVRFSGDICDATAERLRTALGEVESLALQRVVIDLDDVRSVEGAGLDFIAQLHGRWRVRVVNTPAELRAALPRQSLREQSVRDGSGPATGALAVVDGQAIVNPTCSTVESCTSEST
jgi:anti-anti-sigma regulatory factor